MGLLTKVASFFGGDAVREVASVVKEYFPPDVSPKERAELEIRLNEIAARRDAEGQAAMESAERSLTERIAQLEGTAQDLRSIPVVGPIVIFLRGLQRLVWGYSTLYADLMWFSGMWELEERQESALWIINFLVLGFLFGERALQNLMPLITEFLNARTKKTGVGAGAK